MQVDEILSTSQQKLNHQNVHTDCVLRYVYVVHPVYILRSVCLSDRNFMNEMNSDCKNAIQGCVILRETLIWIPDRFEEVRMVFNPLTEN